MRLSAAIDAYVADMYGQGRFRSRRTEVSYRGCLDRHAEDVQNRDPRYTNRQDVKRTLARWRHPNTQGTMRAILVSFYDWLMEEGLRKDNPARQVRRPRRRPQQVYRLTLTEARALLEAATGRRERRAIHLGICAGLRRAELLGLRGRHFARPGWIWVSSDIAKGGNERWVPVLDDLAPIVAEIVEHVADDEYILPAQRWRNPPTNTDRRDYATRPSSEQALWRLVKDVGSRAGIPHPIHPHLLRHAYADHIAKYAGVRNAQHLLGHAGIGTTESYLGTPTLDELAAAVRGFTFAPQSERTFNPAPTPLANPLKATTATEPVQGSSLVAERLSVVLKRLYASPTLRKAVAR